VRATRRYRYRPAVEGLDRRELMAGSVTAGLSQGVLWVAGTSASAPIVVNVIASPTPRGVAGFVVAGGLDSLGVFNASSVRQVVVTAQPGEWIALVPSPVWNPSFQVNRVSTPTPPPPTVTIVTGPTNPTSPTAGGSTETAAEQAIVDAVNVVRAMNGLPPLRVNARLVEAAQIHAADMARLDDMDHTLPAAALPTLQARANYVGYNYSVMGENIAEGYLTTGSVMAGWMGSPGHRANILGAQYQEIGAGLAYDASGVPYYCQVFGTQMA
jgi:uncharacterized protein YkwD